MGGVGERRSASRVAFAGAAGFETVRLHLAGRPSPGTGSSARRFLERGGAGGGFGGSGVPRWRAWKIAVALTTERVW